MEREDYEALLQDKVPGASVPLVGTYHGNRVAIYVAPLIAVISGCAPESIAHLGDTIAYFYEIGYALRNKTIIHLFYYDGVPFDELGEEILSVMLTGNPDSDRVTELLVSLRMSEVDVEFDLLRFQLENAKETIRLMYATMGQSVRQFGNSALHGALPETEESDAIHS